MSAPLQHPNPPPPNYLPSAIVQSNPFSFGNVAAALNARIGATDQMRNAGISNSLPSPLQTNFQSNHLIQSSGYGPINSYADGNGAQNNHTLQNQDFMHYNSYERSMDMHHDDP
ncbi:hypothetical protein PR202_gb20703 [Eleusine coracana subsp. coracana]|uniref:Uncharacterized protein n=1 Tax=Eleusine coracana subsp. coracana TaxID=191504 RepID=A0AAV5FCX4_ELECO|nr:hypothetical protein PR202_gb20703 [Eleusine coracana subsp. coracana]